MPEPDGGFLRKTVILVNTQSRSVTAAHIIAAGSTVDGGEAVC
jgi:hypothetical protein